MYPSLVVVVISLKRSVIERASGFDPSTGPPSSQFLEKPQFKDHRISADSFGEGLRDDYGAHSFPRHIGITQLGTKFQVENLQRDV